MSSTRRSKHSWRRYWISSWRNRYISSNLGNAIKKGGEYAGNAVHAGYKAVGNVASFGTGVTATGIDTVAKGGNPKQMVGKFTRQLVSKTVNEVNDVLATASGFSS